MELIPFQRTVTATLSKLALSARTADSNRDRPTFADDTAATTRVDNDAAELERAVDELCDGGEAEGNRWWRCS